MSYPALPESFSARIREQFSSSSEDFLNALDREINTSVLLHPTKSKFLSLAGTPVPWNDFGMLLNERPIFILDPAYHAGAMYSQEANSMLLAQVFKHILPELKAPVVLDLCAAPGGKSLVLSTLLPEDGLLVSNEIIPQRLSILRENLDKWGLANGLTMGLSPEKIPFSGQFDVIVVDAPCSGEGLFRRQLSYRDEWKSSFAGVCASKQEEILEEAHRLLKPGGFLIYSTCTYAPEENEQQIMRLVNDWDYTSLAVPMDASWQVDRWKENDVEAYRMLPHLTPGEGFFCALLRKADGASEGFRLQKNADVIALSKKETEAAKRFVSQEAEVWKNEANLVFTGRKHPFLKAWLTAFPKSNSGTHIGTLLRDEFLPAQALANTRLSAAEVPIVEVTKEEALQYLRRETIPVQEKLGWCLITHQHQHLGWGKALGNRFNNYYPNEWRIRQA